MDKVKLAVIYYSATGTNYQLARWAAEHRSHKARMEKWWRMLGML